MLPSILYIIWPIHLQGLRLLRSAVKRKIYDLTFDLDLGVKVTQNIAQYLLHNVTYLSTKFEVASPNGIGGDAFTRKYII